MFRRIICKIFNIVCIVILLLYFFFCKFVFVFFRYRLEYIVGGGGDVILLSLILWYDIFFIYMLCNDYFVIFF